MPMTAKGLAKLLEECGELTQIAAKKIAYFHTDEHPDGGGSLKRRLEEEIADVVAASFFVIEQLKLDEEFVNERAKAKYERFMKWHAESGNNDFSAVPD